MNVFGIDVSHWAGVIDWETTAQNIGFAWLKCTEGTGFFDNRYTFNNSGCFQNNVPHGPYHFFRPNYDPVQQADWMLEKAGDGLGAYCCDVETPLYISIFGEGEDSILSVDSAMLRGMGNGIVSRMFNRAFRGRIREEITRGLNEINKGNVLYSSLVEMVDAFLGRIEITGKKGVFYSSPWFWYEHMRPHPNWNEFRWLWEAHYTEGEPAPMPPWETWKFWQYSDRLIVPGIPSLTDGNWFQGTPEEVVQFFGNGEPPPPPGTPEKVRVSVDVLNVRNEPSTSGGSSTVIAKTYRGIELDVIAEQTDESGRRWFLVNPAWIAGWLVDEVE